MLALYPFNQITSDKLTQIAQENWSSARGAGGAEVKAEDKPKKPFSPDLVKSIYMEELGGAGDKSPSLKRVMLLEISQVSDMVWTWVVMACWA